MIFSETTLKGAFIIDSQRLEDGRGFFARTFCRQEFAVHGLDPTLVQCSISFNKKKGTLRGMHYQAEPYQETKLVRCTRGAIHDVIIDLRPESPTFMHSFAVELTAENWKMLYIPEGVAHGFQTMEDNTEVFYQISRIHVPEAARGIRWDDPAFELQWPPYQRVISKRDQAYPDFAL